MENTITRTPSVNTVILSGIIGDEKNIFRNTAGSLAAFSMAHRSGRDQNGAEKTVWIDVKVFSSEKTPNDLSIITKGQKVVVEGRLDVETFTRRDGTPGSKIILMADSVKVNVPVTYEAVPDYGLATEK